MCYQLSMLSQRLLLSLVNQCGTLFRTISECLIASFMHLLKTFLFALYKEIQCIRGGCIMVMHHTNWHLHYSTCNKFCVSHTRCCILFTRAKLRVYQRNGLHCNNNNRFMTLRPGLPSWAGSKRNIHPPTNLIIIKSLSASSIYYDP